MFDFKWSRKLIDGWMHHHHMSTILCEHWTVPRPRWFFLLSGYRVCVGTQYWNGNFPPEYRKSAAPKIWTEAETWHAPKRFRDWWWSTGWISSSLGCFTTGPLDPELDKSAIKTKSCEKTHIQIPMPNAVWLTGNIDTVQHLDSENLTLGSSIQQIEHIRILVQSRHILFKRNTWIRHQKVYLCAQPPNNGVSVRRRTKGHFQDQTKIIQIHWIRARTDRSNSVHF